MPLKTEVRRILADRDRGRLLERLEEDRKVVTAVNRLLFDRDELIRWRAVEALGWIAREDPYILENVIGRLIYTMNDDAGQVGWTAPQALGEICANDPDLVEDFFSIVIGQIDLGVFTAGVLWAIGRVAGVRPDLVEDTGPLAVPYLTHPDPGVRGLAAWALGEMGYVEAAGDVRRLLMDKSELTVYEEGEVRKRTVAGMAEAALGKLITD